MNNRTTKILRATLAGLALLLTASVPAATVTWTITITPPGGGTVDWRTTSPAASGTLTNSRSITFNSGSYVDLTFKPKAGSQLKSVYKNIDLWTPYLDSNLHYQFGPVGSAHSIVVVFSIINPTGSFNLAFPGGSATAVVDVTGNYSGIKAKTQRKYNLDVAMDEVGKLTVLGTVDGIVPQGGGPIQGTVGSIKTVSGKPTAQLTGSFVGTQDGVGTTATGSVTGPVVFQPVSAGKSTATGVAAGSAKVGTVPYSLKSTTTNFPVTMAQAANVNSAWSLAMTLGEKTDGTLVASSILTLPSYARTSFSDRTVTNGTSGYSVRFSGGTKMDGAGNPLLDPITRQPVLDTKSSVTITGMKLTGSQGHWIVTDGTVTYAFFGQSGTGNAMNFTGPEETLFNNMNTSAVTNRPTQPTTLTIARGYAVTHFSTYHWNNGRGTTTPGKLSLVDQNGKVYGPWQATGTAGQGGVPNATWTCKPGVYINPGTYTVVDTDPATWSQNNAAVPVMTPSRTPSGLTITFQGTLQRSDTLNNDSWTDITNPSPHSVTVTTSNSNKFFRAKRGSSGGRGFAEIRGKP